MTKTMQVEGTNEIKKQIGTTSKKGPRGQVLLYARWCKGCHICVSFCPTGVLEMHESGDFPVVAQPEKCTACHFCDTHCPDLAIVVRRI
jgi:2-oxoglutarate ferredoxin oxidoreductase subunit delta